MYANSDVGYYPYGIEIGRYVGEFGQERLLVLCFSGQIEESSFLIVQCN